MPDQESVGRPGIPDDLLLLLTHNHKFYWLHYFITIAVSTGLLDLFWMRLQVGHSCFEASQVFLDCRIFPVVLTLELKCYVKCVVVFHALPPRFHKVRFPCCRQGTGHCTCSPIRLPTPAHSAGNG